jgi:hypothetical protein
MKNLINRNWKASASNRKKISIINNLMGILFSHKLVLFDFKIVEIWWHANTGSEWHSHKDASICPHKFRLEFLGLRLEFNFNHLKEIRKNRFEADGKCWHTQFIGPCFMLDSITISWTKLDDIPFCEKKLIWFDITDVLLRTRKHGRFNERKFFWTTKIKLINDNGGIWTALHKLNSNSEITRFTFKIFKKTFKL